MKPSIRSAVLAFTNATDFQQDTVIQTLWSGYGEILRLRCFGADVPSETVIAKYVSLPNSASHPRGWNTDLSHQRKIRSYQVESHWYKHYAHRCDEACRVPRCFGAVEEHSEFVMVLEDLDAAGFSDRVENVTEQDVLLCVRWLANFHATFLEELPSVVESRAAGVAERKVNGEFKSGLWEVGTYWHLATRPDEYAALAEGELKHYAQAINQQLNNCRWQTLVHGDAKLANFCFSDNRQAVAAVDFQYVGGGCGMKDLAYFMSSCLREDDCERYEQKILVWYFDALKQALIKRQKGEIIEKFAALEQEWREHYPMAWTDFYRFLQGWSPGHWKIHSYSERLAAECIATLKNV